MDIEQLKKDIKAAEGIRLTVYNDSLGKPTIGYGRLVGTGGGITLGEAEYLLSNDINHAFVACDSWPWFYQLSDTRQRALVELCFNMGFAELQRFKKMIAAMSTGDYETAASELLDSAYATQVPSRAHRLAGMIRG